MSRSRDSKVDRHTVARSNLSPLSASLVRTISLQNHLALKSLCSAHGESLHVTFLFRALYLTYMLCDTDTQQSEIDVFLAAEAALGACSNGRQSRVGVLLASPDIGALKTVLTWHDGQLESVCAQRYEAACEQLLNYVMNGGDAIIRPANRGAFAS